MSFERPGRKFDSFVAYITDPEMIETAKRDRDAAEKKLRERIERNSRVPYVPKARGYEPSSAEALASLPPKEQPK